MRPKCAPVTGKGIAVERGKWVSSGSLGYTNHTQPISHDAWCLRCTSLWRRRRRSRRRTRQINERYTITTSSPSLDALMLTVCSSKKRQEYKQLTIIKTRAQTPTRLLHCLVDRGCIVGAKRGGAPCRVKIHRRKLDLRCVNVSGKVTVHPHVAPDQYRKYKWQIYRNITCNKWT